MGRKSISGEPKGSLLKIRLTAEELAELDKAAGDAGTSTWAREVLLGVARIPPPALPSPRKRPARGKAPG